MKKKIICAILGLMVVLSMTGAVVADGVNPDPKDVTATYGNGDETYTWAIPDSITVNAADAESPVQSTAFGVSAIHIKSTSHVTITIKGNHTDANHSLCVEQGGEVLKYGLVWNTSPTSEPLTPATEGEGVDQITRDFTDVKTATITATLASGQTGKYAGDYKDTLTFTATLVSP